MDKILEALAADNRSAEPAMDGEGDKEMKNVLELFYDQPIAWGEMLQGQDSPFVKMARLKNEHLEMFNATMTDEQKELLEAYFDADSKIEDMIYFNKFRYAFHLGAQLMAELIEGKEELLK